MRIKEYNKILSAAYNAAIEIPEVAEALRSSNSAYLYDVKDIRGKAFGGSELHKIICLERKSQMNAETLRQNGFSNPENTEVTLLCIVNKQTKIASF